MQVFDQYTAFVALEPTLFSLGLPEAYVDLNDPTARDYQIEVCGWGGVSAWKGRPADLAACMNECQVVMLMYHAHFICLCLQAAVTSVVDGLFSVCVTLGTVPIIRCPRGGAAEHVAALLDQKLRDSLKARNNLFSEGVLGLSASLTRPLLCLFDRNFDLSAAVQHAWTYKPLVQDVLGLKLNRITLASEATPGPAGPVAGESREYSEQIHSLCLNMVPPAIAFAIGAFMVD